MDGGRGVKKYTAFTASRRSRYLRTYGVAMRRPNNFPPAASLEEMVALTLLSGSPPTTLKVTPLVGPPEASGTRAVVHESARPKSPLCWTLSVAVPRLAALRMLKVSTRLPLLRDTLGKRLRALTLGSAAPSKKAMPLLTPSPLASASKAAPPDHSA